LKLAPTHFPQHSAAGPWGVSSTASNWYVCHKVTHRALCIGPVGSKRRNYFDRALEVAHERNTKEKP
jgi:hypothetical protein